MKQQKIQTIKLLAINLAILCGFSGCSLFDFIQRKATQGNLPANQWYVEKIIIADEEFLSPQVLAQNAQESLKNGLPQESSQAPLSQSSNTSNGANTNNANTASNGNNGNGSNGGNGSQPTPIYELAQIDKIATMDFETKENRISGESGCGSYYARYSWNDKTHLEIVPGSATRKICTPREVSRFEFRFVRGLEGVFEITHKDEKKLTLQSEKMTIHLYR